MSTIFALLGLAQQSLEAQQLGLEITQRNIANANTPGYTRQRVAFVPGDSTVLEADGTGTGIIACSIESFRDRFIEYRISQELQAQGEQDAILSALQQVEALLGGSGGLGLQGALSDFFNSFSALANAPEDFGLREQVLVGAGQLAREFRRLYGGIQGVQTFQDGFLKDTVDEINSITSKIATLNTRITTAAGLHSTDESMLRDQRQQLMERLSSLIDVSYFETESGSFTVMTKRGSLLVIGEQSHALSTASLQGGLTQIMLESSNITSEIQSGQLGGLLRVQDTILVGYLSALDDMAAALIARVNDQHVQGSDLNGVPGSDFFVPFVPLVPGSNQGAASGMAVAISDPAQIAAAGLGSGPGSNANAQRIAAIRNEKLLFSDSATLNQFYSDLIFNIGIDVRAADEDLENQRQVLLQLDNQRDSSSGVSLDEEAVNIIRYQKAYTASAHMVQVLDGLSEELIRLLGA